VADIGYGWEGWLHFPSTAVAKQAGEKRKVGAPEEKEAKRQRMGEAKKEALLRLYFKRKEEELKEQEQVRASASSGWPI
jgi:hypothetical protein